MCAVDIFPPSYLPPTHIFFYLLRMEFFLLSTAITLFNSPFFFTASKEKEGKIAHKIA